MSIYINQKTETVNNKRFNLLWTRKEAYLKASVIGIINKLTQVEVSEKENHIDKKLLYDLISDSIFNKHFIYQRNL